MTYDKAKNGWNRDWETDNIPDDMTGEPVDLSNLHMETCPTCDMPTGECNSLPNHYPVDDGFCSCGVFCETGTQFKRHLTELRSG